MEGIAATRVRQLAALWHKPDRLTDDDWREAGVIHPEYGEHMDDLADRWGRGAVSRLMASLEDLRTLRKSFVEIRHDAERAADIAARTLAKKIGKVAGMTEAEMAHAVREACPARVDKEDSAGFVREMARHLKAIVREAQGDPDPWGSRRWRQKQQAKRCNRAEGQRICGRSPQARLLGILLKARSNGITLAVRESVDTRPDIQRPNFERAARPAGGLSRRHFGP